MILFQNEKENVMKTDTLIQAVKDYRPERGAWEKGVKEYAIELVESLQYAPYQDIAPEGTTLLKQVLLNGARDWSHYSYGGNSLIYDCDIAERLCSPSELKKKKGGDLPPNSREDWLDVQARALHQACNKIIRIYCRLSK